MSEAKIADGLALNCCQCEHGLWGVTESLQSASFGSPSPCKALVIHTGGIMSVVAKMRWDSPHRYDFQAGNKTYEREEHYLALSGPQRRWL